MMKPSLDDWVWVQAMLSQAMIGVVSTNVRQMCLVYKNGWVIEAILEQPRDQDVDDIQDIADETSIYLEDIKDRISPAAHASILASTICSTEPLENPASSDCRIIYRRKEGVAARNHSAAPSSGT
ncbi:hypothetical protein EB810_06040 [Altererythrobacter sp. FM1]|nr:hypothetical protein EB810_06040 [Altererythrobacter sp. FM1]